jgi:hypothetical protein
MPTIVRKRALEVCSTGHNGTPRMAGLSQGKAARLVPDGSIAFPVPLLCLMESFDFDAYDGQGYGQFTEHKEGCTVWPG